MTMSKVTEIRLCQKSALGLESDIDKMINRFEFAS